MTAQRTYQERIAAVSTGEWPEFLNAKLQFERYLDMRHLPHHRAANGICRWCGQPVSPPRRTWCSERCVDQYTVRSGGAWARRLVELRDHGVCSECGIDTGELEHIRLSVRWQRLEHYVHLPRGRYEMLKWRAPFDGMFDEQKQWGPWNFTQSLWEADHVLPVVKGGGCCDLSNLRTLCQLCHKRETKALAGRRAVERQIAGGRPQQTTLEAL